MQSNNRNNNNNSIINNSSIHLEETREINQLYNLLKNATEHNDHPHSSRKYYNHNHNANTHNVSFQVSQPETLLSSFSQPSHILLQPHSKGATTPLKPEPFNGNNSSSNNNYNGSNGANINPQNSTRNINVNVSETNTNALHPSYPNTPKRFVAMHTQPTYERSQPVTLTPDYDVNDETNHEIDNSTYIPITPPETFQTRTRNTHAQHSQNVLFNTTTQSTPTNPSSSVLEALKNLQQKVQQLEKEKTVYQQEVQRLSEENERNKRELNRKGGIDDWIENTSRFHTNDTSFLGDSMNKKLITTTSLTPKVNNNNNNNINNLVIKRTPIPKKQTPLKTKPSRIMAPTFSSALKMSNVQRNRTPLNPKLTIIDAEGNTLLKGKTHFLDSVIFSLEKEYNDLANMYNQLLIQYHGNHTPFSTEGKMVQYQLNDVIDRMKAKYDQMAMLKRCRGDG